MRVRRSKARSAISWSIPWSILGAVVHPANVQDRDGAVLVLDQRTRRLFPFLETIFADSAYGGPKFLVKKPKDQKGFEVLPRRWVVERNWINRCRRLSKDFENLNRTALAFIRLASIRLMLRRLVAIVFLHKLLRTLRPDRAEQPLKWKKPKMIFVNSMSDLFHKDIPRSYIGRVFDTMEKADWHVFQILTKRSSLMMRFANDRYKCDPAPEHIWLGASVEDHTKRSRIKHVQNTNASVRFLSIEPLIGPPGNMNLDDINWVIVGGESGPNARPIQLSWARSVRDQCVAQNVPFFFKQWGGFRPKSGGRELDGKEWSEFPELSKKSINPQELYVVAE